MTMHFQALACDYDGTLAHNGQVDEATCEALAQCRQSGRKVLMVSGRELPDLRRVFSRFDLFDLLVLENGGLLHFPATGEERLLCDAPAKPFLEALLAAGVSPVSVGQTIVATWEPHEVAVLKIIRDLGLELQVIFNKGAVMVLPSGVNKATGLAAGLQALGIEPGAAVGIGDAENDHAFLDLCGAGVAVANALPSLKERATWVTPGDHGTGVRQLVARLVRDDLADLRARQQQPEVLSRLTGDLT